MASVAPEGPTTLRIRVPKPSRRGIRDEYKRFTASPPTLTMDEECRRRSFHLLIHQRFLQAYARKPWQHLLCYHQIGSGKTGTGFVMAESFLSQEEDMQKRRRKVLVLFPARLRSNWQDECPKFTNPAHHSQYTYWSTGGLTKDSKAKNLKTWARDLTQNTMIIIDEAHNLLSSYDIRTWEALVKSDTHTFALTKKNTEKPVKGRLSMLLQALTRWAHPTAKFVLLTATPLFDNITSLHNLVQAFNPYSRAEAQTLRTLVEQLRGKVSFFPGSNPAGYPTEKSVVHDVPMSELQRQAFARLGRENHDHENEAFMSTSRQIALCVKGSTWDDPTSMCPKIQACLQELGPPGKHVIYSNFVKFGTQIVKKRLLAARWVCFNDLTQTQKKTAKMDHRNIFAMWGDDTAANLSVLKRIFNHTDNIRGDWIKVMVGGPQMKEGVSFLHVQHMHVLDLAWNVATRDQIKGRAIRHCSHAAITNQPQLTRTVTVHYYHLTDTDKETVDDKLNKIMKTKHAAVLKGEKALKEVALDFHLFRALHAPPVQRQQSQLELDDEPVKRSVPARISKKLQNPYNHCEKNKEPTLDQMGWKQCTPIRPCPPEKEKHFDMQAHVMLCQDKKKCPSGYRKNQSERWGVRCKKGAHVMVYNRKWVDVEKPDIATHTAKTFNDQDAQRKKKGKEKGKVKKPNRAYVQLYNRALLASRGWPVPKVPGPKVQGPKVPDPQVPNRLEGT